MSANFAFTPSAQPMAAEARAAALLNPGFGKIFTDHMLVMNYSAEEGWDKGEIRARAPFQVQPGSAVLHYAQEIFEGMKAYRLPDGGLSLFRPEANARRFAQSAERMAMPVLPEQTFIDAVRAFVKAEQAWTPTPDIGSLYLRPFMFADEAFLGVRPAGRYSFVVIGCPAGGYFKAGADTVTIWVSETFSRAGVGGTGAAKCGGNYAASLVAQAEGMRHGCDQVMFLDAAERSWIEELGGMNVFFVFADGSLLTPPLEGTILPGVTRDSLIRLARDAGLRVREEKYAISQCIADAKSGALLEAFACGTAAVVAPIARIRGKAFDVQVADGRPGEVTTRLRAALSDIQFGRTADPYGWVRRVV